MWDVGFVSFLSSGALHLYKRQRFDLYEDNGTCHIRLWVRQYLEEVVCELSVLSRNKLQGTALHKNISASTYWDHT